MKILFILQNAYYTHGYRPRDLKEWERRLWVSFTGRRLAQMIPDGATVSVINASLSVGDHSTSCFDADINHIRRMIIRYDPDVICACGKIAQKGCDELGVSYVPAPHPAWRALSKKHIAHIRQQLGDRND